MGGMFTPELFLSAIPAGIVGLSVVVAALQFWMTVRT